MWGVSGACRYLGEGSYGVVIAADDKTDKDTKVRLGERRGREGGRGWGRGGGSAGVMEEVRETGGGRAQW